MDGNSPSNSRNTSPEKSFIASRGGPDAKVSEFAASELVTHVDEFFGGKPVHIEAIEMVPMRPRVPILGTDSD